MWSASLTCFAALCSLSTLVSEASAIPLADQGGKTCRKTKVAILGAGITGITAAQALTNSSVTDFIIVDRNDYIGGRVHHTTFGEKPDGSPYTVELGANWVQGIHSPGGPVNPIWKLARKYDLETSYDNDSSLITYDQTGRSDYSHLIDSVGNKWDAAAAEAGKVLSDNLQDTNVRAGFSAAGWNPKKNMHAQAVDWWNWDYEAAITPQESSFAYGFAGYNATFNLFNDENQFCWDQRGFNTIIIGEANEFLAHNDPRLMLNTVVEGIKYSDKGVTIELDDGACIEAEHALCTFSVGVLQNDVVNFTPSLPTWKTEAIELMQMATYTKIFFQFNETFWDRDTEYFLYADPDQRGYYPIWQSLDAPGYLKDSNIIFVTVTEDQSYQVEQQSNHKTQAEAMAVLRAMFPHKQIPEPTAFMYPRWSLEEYVLPFLTSKLACPRSYCFW